MSNQDGHCRVVIIGGGFAGLFAVRALGRAPVQVTLIDSRQHHLFQPLLYQCATGILSEGKIAAPLREVLRKHQNVDCVMAEVTGIDAGGRRVLAIRPGGEQIEFGYDYLIAAAGVQQSYFGHDEFARWAPGMKTIADADRDPGGRRRAERPRRGRHRTPVCGRHGAVDRRSGGLAVHPHRVPDRLPEPAGRRAELVAGLHP
jgi:thioredoxin reductase